MAGQSVWKWEYADAKATGKAGKGVRYEISRGKKYDEGIRNWVG